MSCFDHCVGQSAPLWASASNLQLLSVGATKAADVLPALLGHFLQRVAAVPVVVVAVVVVAAAAAAEQPLAAVGHNSMSCSHCCPECVRQQLGYFVCRCLLLELLAHELSLLQSGWHWHLTPRWKEHLAWFGAPSSCLAAVLLAPLAGNALVQHAEVVMAHVLLPTADLAMPPWLLAL